MDLFGDPAQWLPFTFAALMGVSILIYVILDGFDLGVGILFPFASEDEKDRMIAAIGPFWDANETWLVLGVGILLVAFPVAHGVILTALYLPVALMLTSCCLLVLLHAPNRFSQQLQRMKSLSPRPKKKWFTVIWVSPRSISDRKNPLRSISMS